MTGMNKSLIVRIIWLTLMITGIISAAEPLRVAVISSDASPWSDLLMTHLSESPSVALLERSNLGKALDEIDIKELLSDPKKRSRFGEIAGADFLVLMSVVEMRARLIVCDTKLGVTLQDQSIVIVDHPKKDDLEILANITLQTIGAFSGGIKQVVAVPDFVCRDLTFDYTYLQSDYAELLRSAYRQIPGLAIVAIAEAKAIATERDLTAITQKDRFVSVFIEGEYRTKRDLKTGEVSVEIILRASDSAKVLLEKKLPSVSTSQAGLQIMSVFTKDLSKLGQSGKTEIDETTQHRILLKRADEFATIGEFVRSTELREAALLLKPDDDEQRIKLVREYARHNRSPFEYSNWPKGVKFDENNPLWLEAFNRSVSDWKRSLQHCEYLVLNRRLSREEATDLAYGAIYSITGVRPGASERLGDCETLKKDFVRHVFSRIAYLDAAPKELRYNLTGALDVYHFLFESALFRCDGNFRSADDLELISDLLLNRLPDTMWPSYNVNFFLRGTATSGKENNTADKGLTDEQYLAFLDQLIASDKPLVNVYGRYGKLCLRRYRQHESSDELLIEARAIVAKAESIGFDLREYDYFMDQLRSEQTYLLGELSKPAPEVLPKPPRKPEKPAPTPTSRITLEPIDLRLANTAHKGEILRPGIWLNSNNAWTGVGNFRSLGAGLDAAWDPFVVFFVNQSGEAIQVLADNQLGVADVISDGRYVWVPTYYDKGVLVLDREGRELASIGEEQGLPPRGLYGLIVHPIEAGRVLVSGSFGNEGRGWIAIVTYDGSKADVKVIHEATKAWDYQKRDDLQEDDPAMCFAPQAAIEHVIPGPKPGRILIIQRRNCGNPLLVDLETFNVEVCRRDPTNRESFLRNDPPANAFMTIDGILWVAGSMDDFCSFRFDEQGRYFQMVRERSRWHAGNGTDGSLARDGDWLYYASYKWRRLNLITGKEELLVEDLKALPDYGTGGWRIANSDCFGLVACHEGKLYRVKTPDRELPLQGDSTNFKTVTTYSSVGVALCLICFAILRKRALRKIN